MFRVLLVILFICCIPLFSQKIDLVRVQATGRPGGAALTQRLVKLGPEAKGLQLEATFQENSTRATWDFPINLDLSQMAALRILLSAHDTGSVRQMDVHLKFGTTWYTANFECSAPGHWEEIIIPRHWFQPEGTPASWSRCDTLRISLWKGNAGKPKLHIAEIRFAQPNAGVAILSGGATLKDYKESHRPAARLADALCKNGLFPALFDAEDTAASTLAPYKLLLLPSADKLTSAQIQAVSWYVRQGGKVAAFYTLPAPLAEQLEIPSGKFKLATEIPEGIAGVVPDSRILPGVSSFQQGSGCFIAVQRIPVTSHVAAWWMDSRRRPTAWPAVIESPKGIWMTHVFLNQDSRDGGQFLISLFSRHIPNLPELTAKELLRQTETAWKFANESARGKAAAAKAKADGHWKTRSFRDASLAAWELREILRTPPQPPRRGPRQNELRAIYCRNPAGLPGLKWPGTLQRLKASGFNCILPYAGAPYEAALLSVQFPQIPRAELASCCQEAHANGMRVVAWVNCLGVEDAPEAVLAKWRQENRLQRNERKQTLNWLCPSNESNRKLLVRLATHTVTSLPFDGIQFDRIRYPSSGGCFCDSCRRAFEKSIGSPLPDWPRVVLPQGRLHARWLDFRAETISTLLAELCNAVLAARPKCILSAAVYPDWDSARASVGQDWVRWCRNRWLSFLTPMNYHDSANQYMATLQRQIRQTKSPERLVPAIGLTVNKLTPLALNAQINANRLENPAGFALFDLGAAEIPQIPR